MTRDDDAGRPVQLDFDDWSHPCPGVRPVQLDIDGTPHPYPDEPNRVPPPDPGR